MLKTRNRRLPAALLSLLVISCADGSTAPPPIPPVGRINVIVLTSGGDPDIDGYSVVVNGERLPLPAQAAGSATAGVYRTELGSYVIVPTGPVTVTLDGIAGNCDVNGSNPRQVDVGGGVTVTVTLSVVCYATGIQVTMRTTGIDAPPLYDVLVDGRSASGVLSNGTTTISPLPPGSHVVGIGLGGDNCDFPKGRQATVAVVSRAVAALTFDVVCTQAVRTGKIAFVMDTTVNGQLGLWTVLINADGSGRSALVRGSHPTWSPDGTRLAYSTTACDDYAYYYDYPCYGGIEVIDPERWIHSVVPDGASALSPAWAPDGEAIAFTRCCTSFDRARIYVGSTIGNPPTAILTFPADVAEPSWSPDGQKLVFTCASVNTQASDLCIAGKDGAGFKFLAVATTASAPAWSPDGRRIAFTRTKAGTARLEVVLLDMNTLVVTPLMDGSQAAWSHDGGKLAVVGFDGLYTINADGTNMTRIVSGRPYAPAWRP